MAVIGCYTLDLYCDAGGDPYGYTCSQHKPGQLRSVHGFVGRTEGDCIRQARKLGWTFNRDKSKAWCPHCSKIRHSKMIPTH